MSAPRDRLPINLHSDDEHVCIGARKLTPDQADRLAYELRKHAAAVRRKRGGPIDLGERF